MRIHKEGRPILTILGLLILIINFGAVMLLHNIMVVYAIIVASFMLYLFVMFFFRYVERQGFSDESMVIAPCDGVVVTVEEVEEPSFFCEKRILVSIFMSPLNVHMNWYPVSGTVVESFVERGSHLVAWAPKSSTHNERSTVVIKASNNQDVLVRQIAGAVARRVVCYAQKNDYVEQNGHLGFIKFGSRVDVYLPVDAKIKVEVGEKMIGTQSPIAQLRGK